LLLSNPPPPENIPDASRPSLAADSTTSAATSDTQLAQLIKDCSRFVWNEPVVRDMQLTISEVVLNKIAHKVVLVVYSTGNGKTHIVRIVGEQYSPIHVDHLGKL
jgi:hypothetical protein